MSLISKWGKTRKMMSTLLSSHTKVRRTRVRDIKTTQEGKTKIERKGFILYIWSLQRFLFVLLWVRACHGWGPCCHSYSIPHRASSECVCVLNVRRIILKMSKATHAHCYSFWLWRKTDDGSKKREKQEGYKRIKKGNERYRKINRNPDKRRTVQQRLENEKGEWNWMGYSTRWISLYLWLASLSRVPLKDLTYSSHRPLDRLKKYKLLYVW